MATVIDPYYMTNHIRKDLRNRKVLDITGPHTAAKIALLPAIFEKEINARIDALQASINNMKQS